MTVDMTDGADVLAQALRERDEAQARLLEIAAEREADAREALRHMRNVLSVVRALAQRTADEADTVEMFRLRFDGRLSAFARVQSAAARALGAIFGDEFLRFGIGVGDGVELAGDPVRLQPRAAGLVALAAHEMVSDYAMAGAGGPVRVQWSTETGLTIKWIEPRDVACAVTSLPDWVEQAIEYELKGKLLEWHDAGALHRRIDLPDACGHHSH